MNFKLKLIPTLALFYLSTLLAGTTSAQTIKTVYRNTKDSSFNCYITVVPEKVQINGVIVRDYSRLPDLKVKSRYQWYDLALQHGFAIIYTVSSNFYPELYYDDSGPALLDTLINEAIVQSKLSKGNIFIGGISASGARALRYTQFCAQEKSKFGIHIKGAFAVDSPLDYERFYWSAKNHKQNFKLGMLEEAEMMVKVFPEKMNGTPVQDSSTYKKYSIYSQTDSMGGNAKFLAKTPLLFFHEPDINWWIEERGATYFDLNTYDIAGLVNQLKSLGNNQVVLKTTSGKGFDANGERKCHSWTIVDEPFLIQWMVDLAK